MLIVADNLQIMNPGIDRAVEMEDPEPIRVLVKKCIAAGAEAIDINSGPLKRNPEAKMRFLVEAVQSATDRPILLDTANPAALAAGLTACRNPAVINGFSLEPQKIAQILPLAREFDADIIGYILSEDSQVPTDESECFNIATALLAACQSAGVNPKRLIIDPVVAPVMWENGTAHNLSVLSLLRHLPELLGMPVRTIAGVSNLTTGPGPLSVKRTVEQSFLAMLAAAGLSMALVNALHPGTVKTARACSALLNPEIFSWAELE